MTGAILEWLSPSQARMERDSLVKHTTVQWTSILLFLLRYYVNIAEPRCQEFQVQPVVCHALSVE